MAPSASAAIPNVFGSVNCTVAADNVRECSGKVPTFDGVPIDVNVAFPPAPADPANDNNYPVVGHFHGWGGSKIGFGASNGLRRWTSQGYAAFSMSDRGWGESCGSPASRLANPTGCAQGWIKLMDTRYEVRDAQEFFARLADEDRIDPQKIGVTGGSYGGGISMSLAALRDRKMLPDGTLVDWTNPDNDPLRIAAAAPEIPWSDLAYSLMPNGRTLDYVADAPYNLPVGIMKQSFVSGLYGLGKATGYYAPPGADPQADLDRWYTRISAGEPYDQDPETNSILSQVKSFKSSYYIPRDGQPPAPLLISNGWTDDIFPVDEALRFYNRTRDEFPSADISLFFLDYGHQRGQNKTADTNALRAAEDAWFAHYLKTPPGPAPDPNQAVTALTQTCPKAAASDGPFVASDWQSLAPGEVRGTMAPSQTIAPGAGSPQIGQTFDPIVSGNDPCKTAAAADQAGTANLRLPAAPAAGYTLVGSPTVVADISSPGPHSQIAARLFDVDPVTNQETLIARNVYRAPMAAGRQVFQLHPNAWRFAPGHIAKLELLPDDEPYSRPTNGQAPVTISNLELRLPVRETPGSDPAVQSPAPKPLPPGYRLAPGYASAEQLPFPTPLGGASAGASQTRSQPACRGGVKRKGTKGDDNIQGTASGDRLRGKRGDDSLTGKAGRDCLRGGQGDDHVNAVDGERDAVRCGRGDDVVVFDGQDRLFGCETRKRRSAR